MTTPEYKKEFIKCLKSIDYSRRDYDVFVDFLNIASLSMANIILNDNAIENEVIKIQQKYKNFVKFSELYAILGNALEKKPCQDFLGSVYQELNFNSKSLSQFFTPYHVSFAMAKMTLGNGESMKKAFNRYGYFTLLDPCCGSGCFLNAARQVLMEEKLDWTTNMLFNAVDIDINCFNMTYIQTSLLGMAGYVYWGNSLTNKMYKCFPTIALYASNIWQTRLFTFEIIDIFKKIDDLTSPCEEKHDKVFEKNHNEMAGVYV